MPHLKISLQPKQYEAYKDIIEGKYKYLFYGGAKGGGKSYLIRANQIERRMEFAGTTGVVIRKTYPELVANHIRKIFQEYPFTKQWFKAAEKSIYFPNGSVLDFRYLSSTTDVYTYQGLEYDDICLDEAGQHEEEVFKILGTSLRSDPAIRIRHKNFTPCFLLTGNPGGIGHGFLKRLFIERKFTAKEKPEEYGFIQSKIYDNPIFLKANPEYLQTLKNLPDDLRRAYLDGDWTVFLGQYFSDFREDVHVIEPFEIDPEWNKLFAVDWGYSPSPYHVGWYAIDNFGNIYKYRELEGLETSPVELAEKIVEFSKEDKNLYIGVGDTQMWEQNPFQIASEARKDEVITDKSIALQVNEVLSKVNLYMQQANKARVTGWTNLKVAFQWRGDYNEDGTRNIIKAPKYRMFKTCISTIAAYPNQIYSKLRPEDMFKQSGDDPCDTDRYALMAISEKVMPEVRNILEEERQKIQWRVGWERKFPDVVWAEEETIPKVMELY